LRGDKVAGCNSIVIEADMSKESYCIRLIDETAKHYGRIDVLVNNAGITEKFLKDTSIEVWQEFVAVDLTGPFVCSREAVKHMLNQTPKRQLSDPRPMNLVIGTWHCWGRGFKSHPVH
jgi:NAD(P)-dependent dehydrogenase (short-subunit alcohol dehydrogenase family)